MRPQSIGKIQEKNLKEYTLTAKDPLGPYGRGPYSLGPSSLDPTISSHRIWISRTPYPLGPYSLGPHSLGQPLLDLKHPGAALPESPHAKQIQESCKRKRCLGNIANYQLSIGS